MYQGRPAGEWLAARQLNAADIEQNHDLQAARIFPVCKDTEQLGLALRWMTSEPVILRLVCFSSTISIL